MHISLEGKHALVGGSSKGIGRAIALQLAHSGAQVTFAARSESVLKELCDELQNSTGMSHRYLVVDYTDLQGYKALIHSYIKKHPVDILVNNTQGPPAGTSLEKTDEDYQKAFDLLLQECGWGRIINVASVSVREPLNYLVLSNSIRAALVSWAKTLARDTGPSGITVNSVLTGYFNTERLAALNQKKAKTLGVSPDKVAGELLEQVPARRLGRPEEYGYLVAFLASEQAGYLNGATIPLDGGLLRSY